MSSLSFCHRLFGKTETTVKKEKNNNIQEWHDEQQRIREEFSQMQPAVSSVLEGFMTFSDKITENYVLQFAKQQIELYNLIADNYCYHNEKCEEVKNEDYKNAVANYREFMEIIVDDLAAFGIEEICSIPGTAFDGQIHMADGSDFSSKETAITKSIRSGFRYQDIIIQKERVTI